MESSFLHSLSTHVFWDVDIKTIDEEKNAIFIVKRVIQYGLLKDWKILVSAIGIEKLKTLALQIPNLDAVSLSFLSNLFNFEKSQFKCYNKKQLNPNFWNY
jgi:hypothetical protein